jgi:hypothetical protein
MTVQELYDWAKERNLLDKQIYKNFNFNTEPIEYVHFLTEDLTKTTDMVVLD